VTEHLREVSPLSRRRNVVRGRTHPLSDRLPNGIGLLPHPLPAVPSATPCGGPTPEGGRRAYHVPRMNHGWFRLCLSAGGSDDDDRGWEIPLYLATYLLVQACQRLWLVGSHDVYQQFTWISHAIHPGPRPPWRWQSLDSLAGYPTTRRRGYVVPRASHRRIAPAARLGRVPMVVHRVIPGCKSSHNKYIRSFVSQLPQIRACPIKAHGSSSHAYATLATLGRDVDTKPGLDGPAVFPSQAA
jgi:hypothetical protein